MNAIEHVREHATNVSALDVENDPMSIRTLFSKAANAVIDASTLRQEVQALRDDVQGLRDTVNRLLNERDEARRERDEAKAQLSIVEADNAALYSKIDVLTQQHRDTVNRLADQCQTAEREVHSLREQLHHVVAERDAIAVERDDKATVLLQTQSLLSDTERLLDLTKKERDDRQLEAWAAQEDARKRSEAHGHLTSQVGDLSMERETLRARIASLESECAEWRFGADRANEELSALRGKLSDISAILAR
jgi:uncharacterized coiled-coil DUF342 family protein